MADRYIAWERGNVMDAYNDVAWNRRSFLDACEKLDETLWSQYGILAVEIHRGLIALEGNLRFGA